MRQSRNKSLCDAVMKDLMKMIDDGIFKEGDQLPNENVLAEQMGVSRTTLREAKNRLVSMNILTKQRGRGTFVVDSHSRKLMEQELDSLNFDQARLVSLYELRMMMEPDIAALAAQKATDGELLYIEKLQQEMEASGNDRDRLMDLNKSFHNAICEATHNDFIIQVFHNINQAIKNNFASSGEENMDMEKVLRSHNLIVGFLKVRDALGARDSMQLHLSESMEEVRMET